MTITRAEHLTLDLLDGALDETGLEELERLVAQDPSARAAHLALCEQEAALRGQLSAIDISQRAMARLRQSGGQSEGPPWAAGAPPTIGEAAVEGPAVRAPGGYGFGTGEPPVPTNASPGPAWGPGGSVPVARPPQAPTVPPPAATTPQAPAAPAPSMADSFHGAASGGGTGAVWERAPSGSGPGGGAMPVPPAPWTPPASSQTSPPSATPAPDPLSAAPPAPWEPVGGADPGVAPQPGLASEPGFAPPPEREPVLAGAVAGAMAAAAATTASPPRAGAPRVETGPEDEEAADSVWPRVLKSSLSSMIVHLVGLILLSLWVLPEVVETQFPMLLTMLDAPSVEEEEREFETVFLDEELVPATEMSFASATSPETGSSSREPGKLSRPSMETVDSEFGPKMALDEWINRVPGQGDLLMRMPKGTPGVARAVVDGYDQALDRITQEILHMLARRKVLLVWCFDQSESMKDDQEEVHARIDKVYAELGMTGATEGDALRTAVTSFGKSFLPHTPQPTTDVDEIRRAIRAVPIDASGKEMMCRAVAQSIAMHRDVARLEDRQMALILVSDESGNQEENDYYLEPTIEQAVAARCRVYVLGREAVFGLPHAHVRWVQPETGREFWLPVDRGPETGFVELLQTDGFERRTDAHPSGFGPYAQSRLAWRTGGIFFMLPSLEANIVRGEKRRYELEAIEAYKPDLRSRSEILLEVQRKPVRSVISKVVYDLNPYREEVAKMIRPREKFPAEPQEFARAVQKERAKAQFYYEGLRRASDMLETQLPARDREPSKRWQANYDLLRAQLVAYGARTHMYLGALNSAAGKVQTTPRHLPPDKRLVGWKVRQHREAPKDAVASEMLRRSQELFLAVVDNHPGTPWAARAEWELKRDFNYPGRSGVPTGVVLADAGYHAIDDLIGGDDASGEAPFAPREGLDGDQGVGVGTEQGAVDGTGVGVGTGAGAGGGGGGGAGGGGGVEVDEGVGGGSDDWGVAWYPGVELVPEYRSPRPPGQPGGGRGGNRGGGNRGGGGQPRAQPTPPPKL